MRDEETHLVVGIKIKRMNAQTYETWRLTHFGVALFLIFQWTYDPMTGSIHGRNNRELNFRARALPGRVPV